MRSLTQRESSAAMCLLQSMLNARCEHREAYKLCEKLERIAEKTGDTILTAEACRLRGENAFSLGHCSEARDSFEQTIAMHRREDRKRDPFAFTANPEAEVAAWSVLSNVLWVNGYPD